MPKVRADFSEAKEQGAYSPRHVAEGDYLFTIQTSEVGESKQGNQQVVFTFVSKQIRGASYPYYCSLDGKGAWKLRALLEACGVNVAGKKAVNFDTDRLHGKQVGATLVDDEYEGKMKSKLQAVFGPDELDAEDLAPAKGGSAQAEEDDEDLDEAPRSAAKGKAAPVEDDDDLDLDDL